jgi:uncharacterized cupredoxin-like copper-binding protein
MGTLFANAPGPRVSAADASRLASQVPAGGRYQYRCPVPGHAREGMAGTFTVR